MLASGACKDKGTDDSNGDTKGEDVRVGQAKVEGERVQKYRGRVAKPPRDRGNGGSGWSL